MKIIFLGTSHGYAEKNRYTSSTMIEINNHIYLIDAGAPLEYLLVNRGVDWPSIRGIFITHMHNDHIGSLSTLIEPSLRYRFNNQITCFIPEKEGLESFLSWMEAIHCDKEKLTSTIHFNVTYPGKIFENEDLKVTAIPTNHFLGIYPAFSYLIESEGKSILFTGDMSRGFGEYPSIIENRSFDLVVCEMAHASLTDVKDMLIKTQTKQMIINHYSNRRIENHETLLASFPFKVHLATDGEEIIL